MTLHQPRIHHLVEEHAARNPDSDAIVDSNGDVYSYAHYLSSISEAAGILRDCGVCSGDRVVLVAENCMVTAVFIFAASSLGAYAVPINARMTAVEIKRVIDHADPHMTLFTTGVSAEAARHAVQAKASSYVSGFGQFAVTLNKACRSQCNDEQCTAVILYTTGTTGQPKGVMLTHGNLRFAAQASSQLRSLVPEDRIYGVLPLTHVFGLASMLMAASYTGACVQLETRFHPKDVHAALTDRVTVFPGVPQMHALVMQYANEQGLSHLGDSPLRYVSSGAAPLDPAWKRKAEAFYGLALQNGYGMTESTAGICGTRNAIGTPDTSVGPPLPGIEIELDRSVGGSVDEGTGEILTRGPHVMNGYFKNPEETARVIDAEGWLRTGDLGKIDECGNLQVVGRYKELIIRGGFNVYPPEVETALNDFPDVIQSAVIGRKSDAGDEEILAFVQCVDPEGMNTAALKSFVSERLASYKRPSRIIATSQLPAAATGKILKHRLLSTFAEQLDTSTSEPKA